MIFNDDESEAKRFGFGQFWTAYLDNLSEAGIHDVEVIVFRKQAKRFKRSWATGQPEHNRRYASNGATIRGLGWRLSLPKCANCRRKEKHVWQKPVIIGKE